MKKTILWLALAAITPAVNAEIIGKLEYGNVALVLMEERIGCPPGLKTAGVLDTETGRTMQTGCWWYDARNRGEEITLEWHGEDAVYYLPESIFELKPNFYQRAQ